MRTFTFRKSAYIHK